MNHIKALWIFVAGHSRSYIIIVVVVVVIVVVVVVVIVK